jgi:type II secretion system protein C
MGGVGIRIANAALFVLSCFLVANVINRASESVLAPVEAPPLPQYAGAVVRDRGWSVRRTILDRNLFGAQVGTVSTLIVEPTEQFEKTRLPLRLLGTIASADQQVAIAAIEDTSNRQHEIVKVGDTLKRHAKVEVIRIDRKRVILQNGDRQEELLLSEDPKIASRSAHPSKPKRSSRRRSARRSRTPDKSGLEEKLAALSDASGGRNAAAIFTGGKAVPKYRDGEMIGLELSDIKENGFYDKLGYQEGDVVTSINGMKVDNPAATQELFKALRDSPTIAITKLSEDGSTHEIMHSREELLELFSAAN